MNAAASCRDVSDPPAAGAGAPLLQMKHIAKRFGATVALSGVDLRVHRGEVVALVGENGAGKSTLMKVLSGAIHPDGGSMTLDGQAYQPTGPLAARRAGVAMIYQELSIAPHLGVAENIHLGTEPTRWGWISPHRMAKTARAALAEMGRADIDVTQPAGQLSLADQQMVEIARALVRGAKVLVFDEPTSSLGQSDIQRLFALIDRLRAQGLGIVYISHFLEEVERLADRVVVLRDGASVGEGALREKGDTEREATEERTARGGPSDGEMLSLDRIVSLMVGRDIDELYPRSQRTAGEAVLAVEDLAGVERPRRASLELHRGEVLGIAGLVGAGRTELLRAIFGLDAVRRGGIRLAGFTGRADPHTRWRQGAGMVSEDRKQEGLALGMHLADNLTLSHLRPLGRLGFIAPDRQAAAARRWIDGLAIRCAGPFQPIATLSGGNQQKVAFARLLHHDVDVLLLDEPTRGIDVGSKAAIYQQIDGLARAGKAVLLVSSYLPELLGVCDRIAVMHRGVLGPARPVEAWDEVALMAEATGQNPANEEEAA